MRPLLFDIVIPGCAYARVNCIGNLEELGKVNRLMKQYYLYILASKKNGTLYIGITGDLIKRVDEHKQNTIAGFTKKYNVHPLVYYEVYQDVQEAI
jgi:hypothetical protein